MNRQPPSRQKPYGQPQSSKSRYLSKGERITLITTLGTILVAIITYIISPVIVAKMASSVTPTPNVSSTASPIPLQNPYPPYIGALVLNNPLHSSTSDWELSSPNSTEAGLCRFTSLAFNASQSLSNHFTTCAYQGGSFMNFAFEVGMTIIQGDCGGIFFDADDLGKHFYYFRICQKDGAYVVDIASNNSFLSTIAYGSNSAFEKGLGQFNTIAVDVQGHNFDLYVNKKKLTNTWSNSYNLSYDQGFIGVLADNLGPQTIVAFNDVKVWKW